MFWPNNKYLSLLTYLFRPNIRPNSSDEYSSETAFVYTLPVVVLEVPSQFSWGQTVQSLTCSIMEKPHTGADEWSEYATLVLWNDEICLRTWEEYARLNSLTVRHVRGILYQWGCVNLDSWILLADIESFTQPLEYQYALKSTVVGGYLGDRQMCHCNRLSQ